MKTQGNNMFITRTVKALPLALGIVFAGQAYAQQETTAPTSNAPATTAPKEVRLDGPNTKTFWGAGLGLVFNSIPISNAKFSSPISHLYYSWYVTDPNDAFRTAVSMGVYGFGVVLPVPKLSAEAYLGSPLNDIQGKVGVGGFYDLVVGGHGGLAIEAGVRIRNRFDISFVTVPTGSDSKRDYREFMGIIDETTDEDKNGKPDADETPHVVLPYYGVLLGIAF